MTDACSKFDFQRNIGEKYLGEFMGEVKLLYCACCAYHLQKVICTDWSQPVIGTNQARVFIEYSN